MAVRYVAPTIDQPSEREMQERAARQRNLFGAGRNLSRAFVRQAAIDYALQQQAAQRQMQQQQTQQLIGQDLATLQQQFQQRAQAGAAERAAQAQLAQLASQPALKPAPENRPLGFVGGPAVVSPSVPGGGPSVDVGERMARRTQADYDAAAKKLDWAKSLIPGPRTPVETMADQTLDLTGESQSERIAREAAERVAEQERRNLISGRTLKGVHGMVEEYGGADTNVADEFDLAVRRDPATRDKGLSRILNVLARRRAGGADKMFADGGYGVNTLSEDFTMTRPGERRLGLGADQPLDLALDLPRFRPMPQEGFRQAGKEMLAETKKMLSKADEDEVDRLYEEFEKSDDPVAWAMNFVATNTNKSEAHTFFRDQLRDLIAESGSGNLVSWGVDARDVVDKAALQLLLTLDADRKRDLLMVDDDEFAEIDNRAPAGGADSTLQGRLSPEVARQIFGGGPAQELGAAQGVAQQSGTSQRVSQPQNRFSDEDRIKAKAVIDALRRSR